MLVHRGNWWVGKQVPIGRGWGQEGARSLGAGCVGAAPAPHAYTHAYAHAAARVVPLTPPLAPVTRASSLFPGLCAAVRFAGAP